MIRKNNMDEIYYGAYKRKIDFDKKDIKNLTDNDIKNLFNQILFLGIKFTNSVDEKQLYTKYNPETYYSRTMMLNALIGHMTPNDFMQLFPIDKKYDGEKYECKDYFYTMEYINSLDKNKPIGFENVFHFLWEYQNDDIFDYVLKLMNHIDYERAKNGQVSCMEEFLDNEGVDTYTINEELGYIQNNRTGRTQPFKPHKRKPSYLKIIK